MRVNDVDTIIPSQNHMLKEAIAESQVSSESLHWSRITHWDKSGTRGDLGPRTKVDSRTTNMVQVSI